MPATPRQEILEITGDSTNEGVGGYAALEPGEYRATLIDVEDYDKRHLGKTHGWVWTFQIQGLPFKMWTAITERALWKLAEVVGAFDEVKGMEIETGVIDIDPNSYIGLECIGMVEWEHDPATHPPDEPNYKRLASVWADLDLSTAVPPATL